MSGIEEIQFCEQCPLFHQDRCPFDWEDFTGPAPSDENCKHARKVLLDEGEQHDLE